ncbi:MAG: hypothetical protein COB78_09600 [Hyphomicrobiales bacterium]|nr:MAG: hypothetical protein COB78_09600 [Hyphomicrobiales bacterium]
MFLLPMSDAEAKGCKKMRDCKDAVVHWCSGESRRDGDGDGIPCENVCRNKEQVDEIRRKIGC